MKVKHPKDRIKESTLEHPAPKESSSHLTVKALGNQNASAFVKKRKRKKKTKGCLLTQREQKGERVISGDNFSGKDFGLIVIRYRHMAGNPFR